MYFQKGTELLKLCAKCTCSILLLTLQSVGFFTNNILFGVPIYIIQVPNCMDLSLLSCKILDKQLVYAK